MRSFARYLMIKRATARARAVRSHSSRKEGSSRSCLSKTASCVRSLDNLTQQPPLAFQWPSAPQRCSLSDQLPLPVNTRDYEIILNPSIEGSPRTGTGSRPELTQALCSLYCTLVRKRKAQAKTPKLFDHVKHCDALTNR